ncbi:hypothetical protein [Cribrihabitans pelagius]|uniref:hypothetical protein n=1 Tax=Cribrihabitans pelagius TaxID=1765746 RepID=UPI003B5B8915
MPVPKTVPGSGGPGGGMSRAALTERQTYRRRRLMDFARLLPVLGALLFVVPLLWPDRDPYPAPDVPSGMPMSAAITYVFAVWAVLILAGFGFGLAVKRWADHWTGGGPDVGPDGGHGVSGATGDAAEPGFAPNGAHRPQYERRGTVAAAVAADSLPEGPARPAMPGQAGAAS